MPKIKNKTFSAMTVDDAMRLAKIMREDDVNQADAWQYEATEADCALAEDWKIGEMSKGAKEAIAKGQPVYTVVVYDENGFFVGYL